MAFISRELLANGDHSPKQLWPEIFLRLEPASFFVIRHVRPKLSCSHCERIVQAAAPSRPIERGMAGPGLLAHALTSKYADHLPLYRQSEIYARQGVELERSTLADWVGGTSQLLTPLVDTLRRYVMAASKLHADDTPVPVLAPGMARRRRDVRGPTFVMIVPQATRQHRRYGLLTHQIVRANIRRVIFASSEEHCRLMPLRASISFTRMDAFRKRRVGPTFGASFTTCNRRTLRL